MRFLTADEVTDLADTIDDRYRALLLAAAYTGCRFEELAGLKTQCVDLLRRTFTIAEALSEVRGEVRMAPPKTAAARPSGGVAQVPRRRAGGPRGRLATWGRRLGIHRTTRWAAASPQLPETHLAAGGESHGR
jgi:integrase